MCNGLHVASHQGGVLYHWLLHATETRVKRWPDEQLGSKVHATHTLSLSPLAPVASALSLPARSTKLSLLTYDANTTFYYLDCMHVLIS